MKIWNVFYDYTGYEQPLEDISGLSSTEMVSVFRSDLQIQTLSDLFSLLSNLDDPELTGSVLKGITNLSQLILAYFSLSGSYEKQSVPNLIYVAVEAVLSYLISISNLLFYIVVFLSCLYYFLIMEKDFIT